MKIIQGKDFDSYWKTETRKADDLKTEKIVRKIIEDVRARGDAAVRKYASKWDKSSPVQFEVPLSEAKKALEQLRSNDKALAEALELAAQHIKIFCEKQREQFSDFNFEMDKGLFTGQRIIPVQKAAVYIPGGRFPLFSSVLMCMIPAFCAGVEEVMLSSPPAKDGLPDKKILAASMIANSVCAADNKLRIFSIGGAQAVAAFALGTQTVPRVDVIAGPGSKFVAVAKRILFGEVGIDFIAGPTDVLIINDGSVSNAAQLIAADMIGQAEHDADARSRALVPNTELANQIVSAIDSRLKEKPAAKASLDAGGLIIVYQNKEEAIRIANIIAPEHLELQTSDDDSLIPLLKNYGSLFIGSLSAEVLGDYSAGINHTLPTSASARFTGGLGVRHFLKTVTTLRCCQGEGYEKALKAAEILARAEGLEGHAQSAAIRNS
ncbi:MAG: histidinol dehydrogenase [Treponema sp.]|nr:histidinol dehydrogenase [Treponema sp.]MCL2252375.1 histidinol dehydrogenase [Treponema sp.]